MAALKSTADTENNQEPADEQRKQVDNKFDNTIMFQH